MHPLRLAARWVPVAPLISTPAKVKYADFKQQSMQHRSGKCLMVLYIANIASDLDTHTHAVYIYIYTYIQIHIY